MSSAVAKVNNVMQEHSTNQCIEKNSTAAQPSTQAESRIPPEQTRTENIQRIQLRKLRVIYIYIWIEFKVHSIFHFFKGLQAAQATQNGKIGYVLIMSKMSVYRMEITGRKSS